MDGYLQLMINFNVRLPDDLYDRLDALADETGCTKSYYIRQALEGMIEDCEDYFSAVVAAEKIDEDKKLEEYGKHEDFLASLCE